jgi:hypothetical protein
MTPNQNDAPELVRLLDAVQSMFRADDRDRFAHELEIAFQGPGWLRHRPPSTQDIARAVVSMDGWRSIVREACRFRSDLFPKREIAVIKLFAFLDQLPQPRSDLRASVARLLGIVELADWRRIFRQVTGNTPGQELAAGGCAAELIPKEYERLCEFLCRIAAVRDQTADGQEDARLLREWCRKNVAAMQIDPARLADIEEDAKVVESIGRRHLIVRMENSVADPAGRKDLWIWQYLDSRLANGRRPTKAVGELTCARTAITEQEAMAALSAAIDPWYNRDRMEPVVEVVLADPRLEEEADPRLEDGHVENWQLPVPPAAAAGTADPGGTTRLGALVPVVLRPLPPTEAVDHEPYRRWTKVFVLRDWTAVNLTYVLAANSNGFHPLHQFLCIAAEYEGLKQLPRVRDDAWRAGIRLMLWHRQRGDFPTALDRPLHELPDYLHTRRRTGNCGYVLIWDNPYWVPDLDRRQLLWSSGGYTP